MNNIYSNSLVHYGILGMKWGVRKDKDALNSKDRVIKKGTTIQNVSSRQLDPSHMDRLYTAYTSYDKDSYIDLMGNFMYNERGYKNTFLLKKDIKIPSDRKTAEMFVELIKENPKQIASDMTKAYNAQHVIFSTTKNVMLRKLSSLDSPDSKRAQKLAKEFMSTTVLDKSAKVSANNFYAKIIQNGYDAISDVNDRDGGMQDPIIVINTRAMQSSGVVKLTKKELDAYSDYTATREHSSKRKSLSEIQR